MSGLSLSEVNSQQRGSFPDYFAGIARNHGSPKIMVGGDSMAGGAAYASGMRQACAAACLIEGYHPLFVGDDTGSSNERLLTDMQYVSRRSQAKGGITAAEFIAGSSPLTAFSVALEAWNPDAIVLDLGTNAVTAPDVVEICRLVKARRHGTVPLFWLTPIDSSGTTVEIAAYDSSRKALTDIIVDGMYDSGVWGRVVNSQAALTSVSRYPLQDAWHLPSGTNTGTDIVTFTPDPGWFTGTEVEVSATVGGLTAGSTYFVARTGVGTFSFHTTRANALAGTSLVDITASITAYVYAHLALHNSMNANGFYLDSTHLGIDGNGVKGAALAAAMFGGNRVDWLRKFAGTAPYSPVPFAAGGSVATTTTLTPGGQMISRKKVLTSLTVNNPDATNIATVTVQKVRRSLDRTTVVLTGTAFQFAVPAGGTVTRGKSWGAGILSCDCAGPIAHLNEEWQVLITTGGSACNVEMEGINLLA